MLRFLIMLSLAFAAFPLAAAPGDSFMSFEMGGGQWEAEGSSESVAADTGSGRVVLGHRLFNVSKLYGWVAGETLRLYAVPALGLPEPYPYVHHEVLGAMAGIGFFGDLYQLWLGYGGGRFEIPKATEARLARKRYAYRAPAVGLGLAVYDTASARVHLAYTARLFYVDEAWQDDFQQKKPRQQEIAVAITLFNAR